MKCPKCGHPEDKVIESRPIADESVVRRRRECVKCGDRFTSYERIEERTIMGVKRDGRREPFDRQKILHGMEKACEKRPISMQTLEGYVDDIERELEKRGKDEVPSGKLGEMVMNRLEGLDHGADVRFASVYLKFRDVKEFIKTIKSISG